MSPTAAPPRRFRPVSFPTQLIVAVAVAAITWTFTDDTLPSWMPPRWADTNAIPRDALLLFGPLVAGVGAWVGGWSHTLVIGPTPARGWHRIAVAQLGPLAASVTVGAIGGLTPALIDTARHATSNGASPLVILSAVTAAIALLVCGFAVGVAWSSQLAPIAAATGTFLGIMAPIVLTNTLVGSLDTGTSGTSFYSVALVWLDFSAAPGWFERSGISAQRTILFTLVAGAALVTAIRIRDRDQKRRRLRALAPFAIPIAMASVMILRQPELIEPNTELTCSIVSGSQVCAPTDIAARLPIVAGGADAVISRFGYGAISEDIRNGRPLSEYVSAPFNGTRNEVRASATVDAAFAVAGVDACSALGTDDDLSGDGSLAAQFAFASDLAYIVALRAGTPVVVIDQNWLIEDTPRQVALRQWSDDQLAQFLSDNAAALHQCSLTALPTS